MSRLNFKTFKAQNLDLGVIHLRRPHKITDFRPPTPVHVHPLSATPPIADVRILYKK